MSMIKDFADIYTELTAFGKKVKPRGLEVLELENYAYTLAPYVRFTNFVGRNLSIDYIKAEFLWYMRGDKFDTSIGNYAGMWKKLVNSDGSINSNYGQYFFGEQQQFQRVVNELIHDPDSRRASVMILSADHLASTTNDYPCTYSVNFRIRENMLNMTVRMRSQDAMFGMGNDAPCFSFIHEMMFNTLKATYSDLEYGTYHHSADSFHVYEKHYKMLECGMHNNYSPVNCPRISCKDEVDFMRAGDVSNIPDSYEFTKWLTTFSDAKYAPLQEEIRKPKATQLTLPI